MEQGIQKKQKNKTERIPFYQRADVLRSAYRNRLRRRFAVVLAGIVVFTSTYAMILPALTLDDRLIARMPGFHFPNIENLPVAEKLECIQAAHQHVPSCYRIVNGVETLICEQEDYLLHTHDRNCYDTAGNLLCDLPEHQNGEEHAHTVDCYEKGPNGESPVKMGWVSVSNYGKLTGNPEHLVCGKKELIRHQHTAECYGLDGEAENLEIQPDSLVPLAGGVSPVPESKDMRAGYDVDADKTTMSSGQLPMTEAEDQEEPGTVSMSGGQSEEESGSMTESESGVQADKNQAEDSGTKVYTLLISNTSGFELPSSGGPGTRFFYILGAALIVLTGAAAAVRKKRRMVFAKRLLQTYTDFVTFGASKGREQ